MIGATWALVFSSSPTGRGSWVLFDWRAKKAAMEIRLLAKNRPENRLNIAKTGAARSSHWLGLWKQGHRWRKRTLRALYFVYHNWKRIKSQSACQERFLCWYACSNLEDFEREKKKSHQLLYICYAWLRRIKSGPSKLGSWSHWWNWWLISGQTWWTSQCLLWAYWSLFWSENRSCWRSRCILSFGFRRVEQRKKMMSDVAEAAEKNWLWNVLYFVGFLCFVFCVPFYASHPTVLIKPKKKKD